MPVQTSAAGVRLVGVAGVDAPPAGLRRSRGRGADDATDVFFASALDGAGPVHVIASEFEQRITRELAAFLGDRVVKAARKACQDESDFTWLAYTVYGNPFARTG